MKYELETARTKRALKLVISKPNSLESEELNSRSVQISMASASGIFEKRFSTSKDAIVYSLDLSIPAIESKKSLEFPTV